MKSVCFACGREKEDPLVICKRCEVKPISQKDKISSVCLSNICLKAPNLVKASRYIRQKRKLPKFADAIVARAEEFVDSLSSDSEEYTQIGFDDSFFDFKGFQDKRAETVTVHAIGKPVKDPDKPHQATVISHLESGKNTYQVLEWEIGKDISIDDADAHTDNQGELYVQYIWLGDKGWTWKHVSKAHFLQLKSLDSMR